MLHLAPSGQAEDVCVDAIRIMDHKPALQDGRDLHVAETAGEHGDPQRIGGAALRAVRELLHAKDPDHVWGGLQKVLTPEGHYLWLCKHHAEEYAK